MRLLAIDCAGNSCSVALLEDQETLATRHEPMVRGHAEKLVPFISSVLKDAEINVADLDLIAVTVGPGTFTGVRIALSAAAGIGLAADVPIVGVTSFDVWRAASNTKAARLIILETKRDDFYSQFIPANGEEGEAVAAPAFEITSSIARSGESAPASGPITVLGDGAPRFLEALASNNAPPVSTAISALKFQILDPMPEISAVLVGKAAQMSVEARGLPTPGTTPDPFYLRGADTGPMLPKRQ